MFAASRLHIDPELPFEGSSAYEGKDDAVRARSAGLKQQRVQSLVCSLCLEYFQPLGLHILASFVRTAVSAEWRTVHLTHLEPAGHDASCCSLPLP